MRTSNNTCTKQRNYSWLSPSWWTHITCKKHLSQHVFPKSHVKMDDLQTRVSQDTFLGRVTGGPQFLISRASDNWHKLNSFALPKPCYPYFFCFFVENHPYILFIPLRVRPRNCWASRARRWCRPLDVRRPPSPTRNWRPIGWHRALRRNRPMSNGVISWKWSSCF